jgi:hypothetical protein
MAETAGNGGSTVGSPAAGAVAPSRMSDLGNGGAGGAAGSRQISDLGQVSSEGAIVGEKMTPLTGPFGQKADARDRPNTQEPQVEPDPTQPVEEAVEGEPEAETEQQQDGTLTPEQQIAKYKEWMDSDQIPEEFLDRPIWVPDGKDNQVPIRLRDVPQNVMLYHDYQKKTTEVAQHRRQNEAYDAGRKRWVQDMNSGDPQAGLRAIRGIGADKTLGAIVVQYIKDMAALEGLPDHARQRILQAQALEDRAYFLEQQLQARVQQEQQAAQQQEAEAAQQGANAPDIKYVQDSITKQLPEVLKALRIEETELFNHFMSHKLAAAASGVRDQQTGQWLTPPTIQLGRAPTKALLMQLATAAKQEADASMASHGRGLTPPPAAKPLQGSGPAAKPGQRGNISTPERRPFSELASGRRSG